jgi:hypothetical protein
MDPQQGTILSRVEQVHVGLRTETRVENGNWTSIVERIERIEAAEPAKKN